MNTETDNDFAQMSYFEIETRARALRAQAMREAAVAVSGWIKARFASASTTSAPVGSKHAA